MKRPVWLAALLLGVLALPAEAVIRNVPGDYPTIQAAVDASVTGDIVQVAPGSYSDVTHPAGNGDNTLCAVVMKSGITIRGAGVGVTVINADSLGRGIHCRGVTNATIRDLTIRRAFAEVYGAAIFCYLGSSPTIFNVQVTECFDGGIICLDNSSPTISACSITDNLAKQGGGLAIEESCSPLVTNTTVARNGAPSGGGVYIRALSAPTIQGCVISDNFINTASGAGGGIGIVNASPIIRNSQILNNTSAGSGGGIAIYDASNVTINNCTILGNVTLDDYGPGGGVYVDFSGLSMDDCVVARNDVLGASSDGAGIFAFFADPMVVNQVTVAANKCTGQPTLGGGISCFFSSPTISKTIIAFNNPGKALHCVEESSVPVVSCCDLFGNQGGNVICGSDAGHNFSLDPLFCDLSANNFRIQLNSPCFPGNHPGGGNTCQRDRIGGVDPGCNPAGVDDAGGLTAGHALGNRPNPFGPGTVIEFQLATDAEIRLEVFDVAGRLIRTVETGRFEAGRHDVAWDGRDESGAQAPSGVYYSVLRVDGAQSSRRMVLMR